MPRRHIAICIGLSLVALANGCSKSPTSPAAAPPSDQAQVTATLGSAASLVNDGLTESTIQGPANVVVPTGYSAQAAIQPYKWWQTVTGLTATWTFVFADTDSTGHPKSCLATVNEHVTGSLVIVPNSDTTTTITKPLDKTMTRQVKLQRLLIGGAREWKVVALTGAFVTTPAPNNTSSITSIRVQTSSGVDTTLTDPHQFFSLPQLLRFGTSDTVHVTVTTTRTDDPVFIHLDRIYRWRLHNNLDYTYSTQWVTSSWPGWRHFGIQVMTHASIYDNAASFDTQAWHFPFRVLQPSVPYYP